MSDLSDYDDEAEGSPHSSAAGGSDPKRHARAQHNALERRRRDNIKDMYTSLRDAVPDMSNERASRAVILKNAIDSIDAKTKIHEQLTAQADAIKLENDKMAEEIRQLRQAASQNQDVARAYMNAQTTGVPTANRVDLSSSMGKQ